MFPYEIVDLDKTTNKKLMDDFKGERNGFCLVGPKKWCLPIAYKEHAEQYYNFKLRADDLWIVTYPRSGTTMTQELLWLINNDLDYETAANKTMTERFPFFEFNVIQGKEFADEILKLNDFRKDVIDDIELRNTPGYVFGETMESPRHLKSHLPFDLLPPKILEMCKVVYVARNPKDVAASFYHHNRLLKCHDYKGDFSNYWGYFEQDLLLYSPYWEHVKEAWEMKNNENLLFLFYEDLINDMGGTIKKIASFLNKTITEEQIEKLKNHLQIDNFRNLKFSNYVDIKGIVNPNEEGFIRRGKIGGNKEFSQEIMERADKWIQKNLDKTDLKFPVKI